MKKNIFLPKGAVNQLWYFLSFLLFLSCSQNVHIDEVGEIEVNLENTIDGLNIHELFSNVEMVKLETTPESLLGEFNKIILSNGKIYVSTGSSIVVFSQGGSFIKKFENVGKGPGEYGSIYDIIVDEQLNVIEVLDAGPQKVLVYDLEFNFIKEYYVGRYAMNFAQSMNGLRVFHCGNSGAGKHPEKILLFRSGRIEKNFLKIDKLKSQYLHLRRFDLFSYYGDTIVFTDAHHDSVYYFDGDRFFPKYAVNIGKKKIPAELYSKPYRDIAEFSLGSLMGSGYAYGIFSFIESGRSLFFRYDERLRDAESMYGKISPYFILYDKRKREGVVTKHLVDDINFPVGAKLNVYTIFFSQVAGQVVYAIPSYEFLDMYSEAQDVYKEKKGKGNVDVNNFPAAQIYRQTKVLDNPILFIAELK